ncbi:phage portal protein [Litorimonas sp. WD9-15]|uniref:phage portal protein n=1 Tax=Litorimonas sp. WD9-15 TaxID=3418716 RepID=UPI003D02EFD6
MTGILKADGSAVSAGEIAAVRMQGKMSALAPSGHTTNYRGAGSSTQELAVFQAPTLSADAANRFERETLANRARKLVRDEPEARTAVEKSTGMVIGSGWRLQAQPDHRALGITEEEGRELATSIERAFQRWATDPRRLCDLTRRHDFGGLLRIAFSEWKTVGECLAVMNLREAVPGAFQTAVNLIDTDRLSNPNGAWDSDTMRDGVELDAHGAPIAYHIRRAHPGDISVNALDSLLWDRVPRESDYGRPVCIHGFTQSRPGQHRGITPLAPVIETFLMMGQYKGAEIQSALINALFGAFVKSGFDPSAVADILGVKQDSGVNLQGYQDVRQNFYDEAPVEFMGVRIPVLMPGDSVDLNTAPRQATAFNVFYRTLMQSVAAAMNVSEGQITGNYTGLNYSTLRGAFNEIWSAVMVQRADFGTQVVMPIYLAVLDEITDRGLIDLPPGCADLWEAPAAWCRSNWVGPARPQIDPEKAAKANLLNLEGRLTSRSKIYSSNGEDFDEEMAVIAGEEQRMEQLSISSNFREGALAPTNPTDGTTAQ